MVNTAVLSSTDINTAITTVNQWRFDIAVRIKNGGSTTFRVRAPLLADLSI